MTYLGKRVEELIKGSDYLIGRGRVGETGGTNPFNENFKMVNEAVEIEQSAVFYPPT